VYVYNNITDVSGAVVFTDWEQGYGHSLTGKDLKCAALNGKRMQDLKVVYFLHGAVVCSKYQNDGIFVFGNGH